MSVTSFLKKPSFPLPMRGELPSLRQLFERTWRVCLGAALLLLMGFGALEIVETRLEKQQFEASLLIEGLSHLENKQHSLARLAFQTAQGRPGEREYYAEQFKQTLQSMGDALEEVRKSTLLNRGMGAVDQWLTQVMKTAGEMKTQSQVWTDQMAKMMERGDLDDRQATEALAMACDAAVVAGDGLMAEVRHGQEGLTQWLVLLGWLRLGVAGGVVLGVAVLFARGQGANLDRLIDIGVRFEDLTYLQNAVLESAAYSIISTTPDGKIVTFNQGAEKLTGYQREEVVGVHTPEIIHDHAEVVKAAAEVSSALGREVAPGFDVFVAHARNGQNYEREWTYVRKDGGRVPVSLNVTAMYGNDGNITGFLGIARDVTENKKLEQQFLRAQRIESIGTLAGGIAHDLNNVLTPILMSIELLRATNTNERAKGVLTSIESSARRGAELVKQILSFARGAEGERTLIKVGSVMKDIQKLIQDTFPKNIRCATAMAADLPTLLADPTQVHQILLNLCVNARDAMPNGGCLTITAKSVTLDESAAAMRVDARPGNYVSISVKDTGTGIPPTIMDKIFDPFFTTKEVGRGTGLGLATVLAIAKSHGGFVQVDSEPGQGSLFTVCLPAADHALPEPEPTALSPEEQPAIKPGAGELILIVDDEENVRTVTQQTLETLGYRTLGAADGVEAVALYSRHTNEIAAVLTDMMMPIMSGPATIQVLRRINPSVKIIAASGITQGGGLAKAAEMGIKYILPKPYSAQTVMSTLHSVLN